MFKRHTPENTGDTKPGFSLSSSWRGSRVHLTDASLVKRVLTKSNAMRDSRMIALVLSAFGTRPLIVSEGEDWKATHDAVAPFFTPKYVKEHYEPVIREVADDTFSALKQKSDLPSSINLELLMRVVTIRIMGHVLFGKTPTMEEAHSIEEKLDATTKTPKGTFASVLNKGMGAIFCLLHKDEYQPIHFPKEQRRALNEFSGWIHDKIKETEGTQSQDGTIVAALRQRYAHQSPRLQNKSIVNECALLFIGGIETTAATLAFAIAEIANNETIRSNVIKELTERTGPSLAAQPQNHDFPYIGQVVQETLRRHSIVRGMARKAGSNESFSDVSIPKGATFQIYPVLHHLSSKVWDNPHQFNPDRFSVQLTQTQKDNFFPFGMGRKICTGRELARMESIGVIASFFSNFEIQAGTEIKHAKRNAFAVTRPEGLSPHVCPYRGAMGNGL